MDEKYGIWDIVALAVVLAGMIMFVEVFIYGGI